MVVARWHVAAMADEGVSRSAPLGREPETDVS